MDHSGSLTLDWLVWDSSIIMGLPLAAAIFDPNLSRHLVFCIYPISGRYDILARCLFYISMVFAIVVRKNSALAIAALGTAMLYSSVAAIHAIILLAQFHWTNPVEEWDLVSSKAFGDTDIHPIKVILIVATLLSTPILNWSTSVRRHRAQIIIYFWVLLLGGALLPVFIYTSYPKRGPLHNWRHNLIPSFLLCGSTGPCSNITSQFTSRLYQDCGCVDFCGTISPATPLRSGQQMVPLLSAAVDHRWYNPHADSLFLDVNGYLPALLLAYGALGLLYSQFSNTEMRNLIFRILIMDRQTFCDVYEIIGRRSENRAHVAQATSPSSRKGAAAHRFVSRFKFDLMLILRARRIGAKYVAAAWFSMVILLTLPSALILVEVLLCYELDLKGLPYNEQSDAVGAWANWLVATLAILASIILHYQEPAEHAIMKFITAETPHRPTQGPANTNTGRPKIGICSRFGSPAIHVYCDLIYILTYIQVVFLEFKEWFQDPLSLSHDTHYETQTRWESKYSCCSCSFCVRRKEVSVPPSMTSSNQQYRTVGMQLVAWLSAKVHERRENRIQQ